tara:strand:+ start:1989 stop:3227 length:1239 start_codon:yes stop_codon:yes gene_type:complete
MNDEIMNEIKKAAELLGMTETDALAKFEDICTQNSIDASKEPLMARALWRQFFSSARNVLKRSESQTNVTTKSDTFFKSAFGFFIALDEARDMMAIQRTRIVNEYRRDSNTTFSLGKVAIFTAIQNEMYEGRMMIDGEEKVIETKTIPNNNVDLEDGTYLVPIDSNNADWNKKNYGKPLAKEEFRRSGVFIGEVNGEFGKYFFNYKGPSSKTFSPPTFEFVHFTCILNSNDSSKIHGATNKTMDSLIHNVDLPDDSELKKDVSSIDMKASLMEYSAENYSPLIDLSRFHDTVNDKPYSDRFVFTDGNATSVNMTPTKNGNRILTLDDLNTDFDYEGDGWSGTTCWIPSHIKIDFGIGSNVIIVGRTSQSTDDNGELQPPSINVNGIYVIKARGGSPDAIEFVEEDEDNWFFD